MAWFILLIAGILETVWAVGLRFTNGFTQLWASVTVVVAMCLSVFLLSVSLKTIPLGTGYAVWTGVGAVGAFLAGAVLFGESLSVGRVVCILLIIVGIAGLKLCH